MVSHALEKWVTSLADPWPYVSVGSLDESTKIRRAGLGIANASLILSSRWRQKLTSSPIQVFLRLTKVSRHLFPSLLRAPPDTLDLIITSPASVQRCHCCEDAFLTPPKKKPSSARPWFTVGVVLDDRMVGRLS